MSTSVFIHLSLLLSTMTGNAKEISQIIGTLFIEIPSLSFVSYKIIRPCDQDRIVRQALTLMKNMDTSFYYFSLHFGLGVTEFSRPIFPSQGNYHESFITTNPSHGQIVAIFYSIMYLYIDI
jgi:hypothetical protein